MRLYHFTTSLLTDQIKRVGLWRGDVPLTPASQKGEESMAIPSGMGVNLTGDPDFKNQRWAAGASIDKLSARVCVEIPDEEMEHLWKWDYMCKVMIDRYKDKPFRIPDWKDGLKWDKDGRMIRDEEGHPVVSKWQDKRYTLAQWYEGLNMDCDHSKWYVFDGEVRPEWITEVAHQNRHELPPTKVPGWERKKALTPSGAIAWMEELAATLFADGSRIAEASTVGAGSDKWSPEGIRALGKKMSDAHMYLWKSSLFANAGTGAEAFDFESFDIELPEVGVVFVPDQGLNITLNQAIKGAEFAVDNLSALLLTPIVSHNGKYRIYGSEDELLLRGGRKLPDGRYIGGIIVYRPEGKFGRDVPMIIRALPLFKFGQPCEGWSSLIKALFMFMEQKIVAVDRHRPPRHERRRLKKERRPIWDLKVVSLRRYAQHEGAGVGVGGVDWQCQWTVSGHWRKQPTSKGVKVIWIDPYIKGPDDKPLRDPTKSIFSVRR